MRKPKKRMSKGDAYKLLIVGLILGTVFIFGMAYWNKTVAQGEAIPVNATYISHKESFRRGKTKGVYVDFSDFDRLYIDGECVNDTVRKQLDKIEKETKMRLLIHPKTKEK